MKRWVCLHSNFSGGLCKTIFSARVHFCCSESTKVIDFGINRKCACDFLLVCHGNFGPILHCFRDIAGFLQPTPYSTLILEVFKLDQIADVGVNVSKIP